MRKLRIYTYALHHVHTYTDTQTLYSIFAHMHTDIHCDMRAHTAIHIYTYKLYTYTLYTIIQACAYMLYMYVHSVYILAYKHVCMLIYIRCVHNDTSNACSCGGNYIIC